MAMRETVSSIRAYFILSGLLAALSYASTISASGGGIAAVLGVCGLALSLAYLYLGFRFKTLLTAAPNQILLVLKAGAAFLIIVLLLAVAGGAGLAGVFGFGLGLLITWYLYVNSKRLVAETQKPATNAAPSTAS